MIRIEEGGTYRTRVAVWRVESISPSGMVRVRRDDGHMAHLGMNYLRENIQERIDNTGITLEQARAMADRDEPLPESFYIDQNGDVQWKPGRVTTISS